MRRLRTFLFVVVCLAALAVLALWATQPLLEQRAEEHIARAGAAAGVTIGDVRFAWNGPLRLHKVIVDRPDTGRVQIDQADITWDLAGGRDPRAHIRRFDLRGIRMQRGPLTMELSETSFEVVSWDVRDGFERLRLRQLPSGGEFEANWRVSFDHSIYRSIHVTLADFDVSSARVRWSGEEVLQPGAWTGGLSVDFRKDVAPAAGSLGNATIYAAESIAAPPPLWRTTGNASARGVRLKLPPALGGSGEFGAAVTMRLYWEVERREGSIGVHSFHANLGGLAVTGRGHVNGFGPDAIIDATFSARTDLAAAFLAAGTRLPVSIQVAPDELLGAASGSLAVRGPLWRPGELLLTPDLQFESTPQGIAKLQFLERPFRYEPSGTGASIEVQAGAPDFISIAAVPPLFVDALLISEDAGFYGHMGVDLAEIRAAWAENAHRGRPARGGSTITQQLVKNLFLSREKSYGRKLEEAALALLVDAALPKRRILEIYVNVIEWGPGLYGLGPASRHYFGKAPGELTPKEIAFLVCLIPSPVRYHQAHVAGRAGPGMEQLMANLLAKLRSVGALGEEGYASALEEGLDFAPEGAPASVS